MSGPSRLALLLVALLGAGCAATAPPETRAPTADPSEAPAAAPLDLGGASYRDVLLDLREADQGPRRRLVRLLDRFEQQPPDSLYRPLARAVLTADSVNQSILDQLVEAYGWPRVSDVGEEAAGGAFLVVQHAPLTTQLRYRPVLEAAVAEGEARPRWLALLVDRILVRQERPQRYGTETFFDPETGTRRFYPLEDPGVVDALRADVGLEPLAEYAQRVGAVLPE